jgi:hypothetical protein
MHAHRTTAKAVAAIAAVGLIPFGLTAIAQFPASEPAPVAPATSGPGQPLGFIAIDTDSTPGITLHTATGPVAGGLETLSGDKQQCTALLGGDQLLGLRGSVGGAFAAGLASYATGSLGVKEKKSGTSCSQVNAPTTETLELKLGAATATALKSPTAVSAAYLDLELKQSAQILATASRGGEVVGRFELRSGTSALPITDVVPVANVAKCANGADSGPDSGVNDNCRWAVSPGDDISFDTLTLQAVQGAFSLEGGGDGQVVTKAVPLDPSVVIEWPTVNASVLELVDGYEGTLACGNSTPLQPADGDAPAVIVHRLNNVGGDSCTEVPYYLGNGSRYAQFLKPLDTQTRAQFVWEVTWRLPYTGTSSVLPQLTLDYETGTPVRVDLGWCPDPSGLPVTSPWTGGYTDTQFNAVNPADPSKALLPDQDEYAGKQFACVISRDAKVVDGGAVGAADDYIQAHDLVYVLGDAGMRN